MPYWLGILLVIFGIVALMNLTGESPHPQMIVPVAESIPVAPTAITQVAPVAKVNAPRETVGETDKSEQRPEKPANGWATAGMTTEDEAIRVEVESVAIGKVTLKDFQGEATSKDELLQIKVRITNRRDAKKVDYKSWSAAGGGFLHAASLRDDLDNSYKRISFGFGDTIIGQLRTESIYPFKSVTDLLVFEVPIGRAKFLKLELPARAYGGSDDDALKLKIPMRSIK